MTAATIAYSSPFVPPEWIAAHGLLPLRLVPSHSGVAAGAGVCPFAHDFVQEISRPGTADAAVFATTCDQMRRVAEQAAAVLPTFLMNVPASWQTPGATELYIAELRRLSAFLVARGGTAPSRETLARTMHEHHAARRRTTEEGPAGPRIALVGGPLRRQEEWILNHIRARGAAVVLDATETGERTLPCAFDADAIEADPLRELAQAYFQTVPDAFRRPDTLLHDYLARQVRARGVRGVLLIRCVWCDQWHAQAQRLKASLGVPVVEIDLGQDDGGGGDMQRLETRIDSLLDMVGGMK